MKIYPNNIVLKWYYIWILLEEKFYQEAENELKNIVFNKKIPILNIVKAKLELNKWNKNKAIIFFKKTIELDKGWDFWKIAENELKIINNN